MGAGVGAGAAGTEGAAVRPPRMVSATANATLAATSAAITSELRHPGLSTIHALPP